MHVRSRDCGSITDGLRRVFIVRIGRVVFSVYQFHNSRYLGILDNSCQEQVLNQVFLRFVHSNKDYNAFQNKPKLCKSKNLYLIFEKSIYLVGEQCLYQSINNLMKKHHFLIEKLLLFLFYLQSMIVMEDQQKQYFWLVAALVAIISFAFEGARPYTPIFLMIFVSDFLEMTILQTVFVVLLGFLMAYIKFYHIQIVGKGPYNAGYRYYKHDQLQMGVFYPSMSDGAHCKWIPTQKYNEPLYDIFFVDPTELRYLPFRIFKFVVSYLFKIKMPVLGNATLYKNDSDRDQHWKLVVFSHGLGSNMTNYSSMCGWWATHGYIVISVQHSNDLIRIQFQKEMLKQPDSLEKLLYNKRNEDLIVRANELENALHQIVDNHLLTTIFEDQKKEIKIENIYLAGHSYGGATVLETMANLIKNKKDHSLIEGLICMDAWFFPLSNSTYQNLQEQNILLLNSDTFFSVVPYIYYMEEKMGRLREANASTVKAFMVKKTDHLSTSDFAFTFGNMLKLNKMVSLQEHTPQVLEFHEIVISLFMEGKSTKEILEISNSHARKSGLMQVGVCLMEQWRYQRQNKEE